MITTKTITIGDRPVVVSELTVGQIDQAVGALQPGGAMHRYYNLMGYELTPEVVALSTGVSPDGQGAFDPEELEQLVAAAVEVNARFLSRIVRQKRDDPPSSETIAA